MIRATAVRARSSWKHDAPGTVLADTVVLDFDDRHRRRIAMTGTGGLEFLLDLPDAIALRGGDALVLSARWRIPDAVREVGAEARVPVRGDHR